MLSQTILDQLKTNFEPLENEIVFSVRTSTHVKQKELLDMLESVASTSSKITILENDNPAENPEFSIQKRGEETGIVFKAVPGGHEFTSLVLAVLHADGKAKWPDEMVQHRVASLKGPIELRTFISLSCTNCPDVVQALNQMSLIHPQINHTMIDGDLAQEEVSRLGIKGVPAVFHGDKLIHSGRADFGELIDVLEREFGSEPKDLEQKDHGLFDVAVIGGGPAGCASGIYSARKGLRTAIIAGKIGGQVNDTAAIENLISVPQTTGTELSANLSKHANHYDLHIFENRAVESIETGDTHRINGKNGEFFQARRVIIATGASWRKLGVPGEDQYLGKGVAFCPHCDGPFFAGKDIAVIGGGNSGVEAAIDLAGICASVTLIEFLDELKADQVLINKLKTLKNVTVMTGTKTTEILGDGNKVTSLVFQSRANEKKGNLNLDGVFVQIGLVPNSQAFTEIITTNRFGEIEVDTHGRTSVEGIYAAGDVTTSPYKQIVIAMGDGAKASLAAFEDHMRVPVNIV